MSLIEDRLTRILELRIQGLDEKVIAKELGLEASVISHYEESAKKTILGYVSNGVYVVDKIASKMNLSPVIIGMFLKYYNIKVEDEAIKSYGRTAKNRFSRTKRIKQIKKAIEEGADSVYDVAKKVGLSPSTCKNYLSNYASLIIAPPTIKKIVRRVRKRNVREERIAKIKELIDEGLVKNMDIAKKMDVSNSMVSGYIREAKIKIPTIKERKLKVIKDSLENGERSLEVICKKAVLGPNWLFKYCKDYGIALPDDLNPWKKDPKIDGLIEKGLTLAAIGLETGNTRELIRQYIKYTGQYKGYRKKREEVEKFNYQKKNTWKKCHEKKKALGRLESVLKARLVQLGKENGFAYEKATEYIGKKNYTIYTLDTLVKFYKRYQDSLIRGEKLSLLELSKSLGIKFSQAGRLLSNVGLEPLYSKKSRHGVPTEKKAAIQRSLLVNWNSSDVSYFLGLPAYIVQHNLIGARQKINRTIKRGGRLLTKRLESEIYEAKGLTKLKNKEIIFALDINKELFDYAIAHRHKFEPEIIKGLKIIYGNPNIEKPYKDLSKLANK